MFSELSGIAGSAPFAQRLTQAQISLRRQSRLGRRPSIGIMNAKLESPFND
jgi:hypothetical protein